VRRRLTILLVAASVLAVPAAAAPAARADDASLFAAYDSPQQTELRPVLNRYIRWLRRWDGGKGGARPAHALIRSDRQMNRVLGRIAADVRATAASTDHGENARRYALVETKAWQDANVYEIRGLEAWLGGRSARKKRLFRRAERVMLNRTYPAGRHAVRAFAAAGLHSRNDALSQDP
jgi:hypothetical protein